MTKMNQSGQAFSVFKILIAAIVAVSILAILLPLLNIPGISARDPTNEAATKIKDLATKLGTPEKTGEVDFQPDSVMSAITIATKSQILGEGEVCLVTGKSAGAGFLADGKLLQYEGRSKVVRRLYILCDLADKIEGTIGTDLRDAGNVSDAFIDGNPDYSACGFTDAGTSNRVCIVSVISSGGGG